MDTLQDVLAACALAVGIPGLFFIAMVFAP